MKSFFFFKHCETLIIGTDKFEQIVQTQVRVYSYHLEALLNDTNCSVYKYVSDNYLGVPIFRIFMVLEQLVASCMIIHLS